MRRCGSKTYIKITPAVLRKGLQIRQGFYGSMLVAVATVLPYKPVFAQALGFLQTTTLAVKECAAHRAVGVVHLGNTVAILEALVSFFTGHQKKLFHGSFSFVFKQFIRPLGGGTQRLLLYHDGDWFTIVFLSKDMSAFSLRLWQRRA